MLTINQKRFFVSLDELALVCETWFKIASDRIGVCKGKKPGIFLPGKWD